MTEKEFAKLEANVEHILVFIQKIADGEEAFTLAKKDIEDLKHTVEHLSDTINKEIDIYMNKPNNREDLANVIDTRIDSKMKNLSNSIALKVLGGVTAIATTVLTGVIMLWIK